MKGQIISQINTRKAENAVEVAKNLNNIFKNHVSIQTIQNVLKKSNMKAVVKKKKPLLFAPIRNNTWILLLSTRNGLWTIRGGLSSQMRPKSTNLDQMAENGYENRKVSLCLTRKSKKQSSIGVEI